MADEPSSADAYDVVLADLLAQREKIDQAIAAIQALRGNNSDFKQSVRVPAGQPSDAALQAGMFLGKSIAEAAKQLLAIRKTPLGNQEVTNGLMEGGIIFSGETPVNTVGSVMHRESQKEGAEIVRVGRGKWGLAAWFSNPGRFRRGTETATDSLA